MAKKIFIKPIIALITLVLLSNILTNCLTVNYGQINSCDRSICPATPTANMQQRVLSRQQLYQIARSITVKIKLKDGNSGSGFLVNKERDNYTVLTNDHVVFSDDKPKIVTHDNKTYQSKLIKTINFDGDDLAVLTFQSSPDKIYNVAEIGNGDNLVKGEPVFSIGFPFESQTKDKNTLVFRPGIISFLLDKPLKKGYQIGITSNTQKGMSGGPLLNLSGQVIAVNGRGIALWGGQDLYEFKDGSKVNVPKDLIDLNNWTIPIDNSWQVKVKNTISPTIDNCPPANVENKTDKDQKNKSENHVQADLYDYITRSDVIGEINHFSCLKITRHGEIYSHDITAPYKNLMKKFERKVKDLDGDKEPEIIVDLFSTGNPSYLISLIYYYVPGFKKYFYIKQDWGFVNAYKLDDLNNDGIPEFDTLDGNFAGEIGTPDSQDILPKKIWQYRFNRMFDATEYYNKNDSFMYEKTLVKHKEQMYEKLKQNQAQKNLTKEEQQKYLAAYLAHKYSLKEHEEGWEVVKKFYAESDKEAYFDRLDMLLKTHGYDR